MTAKHIGKAAPGRAWWTGLALLIGAALSRAAAATEPGAPFVWLEAPRPLSELRFEDGEGQTLTLENFRGKVVLLNVWATWCGPCRKEMPTLDRLQARLGGPDFTVVALSIDRLGAPAVKKFYVEIGIAHLGLYVDSTTKAAAAIGLTGLPTTLLIDREGNEVARLVGPAEWDSPDMVARIEQYVVSQRQSKASGVIIGVEQAQLVKHGKCPCPMMQH